MSITIIIIIIIIIILYYLKIIRISQTPSTLNLSLVISALRTVAIFVIVVFEAILHMQCVVAFTNCRLAELYIHSCNIPLTLR